jgi:hypothetical protein
MTHITEARVIGNHAEMGASSKGNSHVPLTVSDILRARLQRRVRRQETDAAQSTWDSEGGATQEGESAPDIRPRGLGR